MILTKIEALRAYAKMMNSLEIKHIENLLADNFCYSSQYVLEEIKSKIDFLDYIEAKLIAINNSNASVFAEIGKINNQYCVIMAQHNKQNRVGLILAEVENNKIKRFDFCIVPSPESAVGLNEYPE